MSDTQIVKQLTAFGLTKKEAELYVASLITGPASVQQLAQKADSNRVTTYVMIDHLTKKGLLMVLVKGKKKYYMAQHPSRIVAILREKEKELQSQIKHCYELLPMLKTLLDTGGTRPVLRVYEGIEGLKMIHEEILAQKTKEGRHVILPVLSIGIFEQGMSLARDAYYERIKAGNAKLKVLALGPVPVRVEYFKGVKTHQLKYLSPKKFPFMDEMGIYDEMVIFYISRGDKMGIVIQDAIVANTMRILFDLLWNIAKEKPQI